jgi:hypothetical protein
MGVPIDSAYKIPGAGLVYWYRLGETTAWPTGAAGSPNLSSANFALDSSGNNHHLTAYNSDSAGHVILPTGDPNLPHPGVSGALEGGNANDGGIEFKFYESGSYYVSCMLGNGGSVTQMEPSLRSGGAAVGTAGTFAAWVAFMPPPGGTPSTGVYSLISTWSRDFGIGNYGARIGFDLATSKLNYHVGSLNLMSEFDYSTVTASPGKWHHFVTQVVKLATNSYRRRIYYDSLLVYELVGDLAAIGNGYSSGGLSSATLSLGGGNSNDIWSVHGGGKIDEVAYWTSELTSAQVVDLWNARVLHSGDTWSAGAGRVTKRAIAIYSPGANPVIDTDNYDVVHLVALTTAITSMSTNLTGIPVDGDSIQFSFTDDGTARAITWGAKFEASTVALPTTTVANARLDTEFVWNVFTSKWRCVMRA